jgi:hypothetical protein
MTDKAQICKRKCTCTTLVALRPCTKPENGGEPADLFDILDTGSALVNSMEGGIRVGCTGCKARSAALELHSVVPQACSSVEKAGFARSGQYVWPSSHGETTMMRRSTSEVAGGMLRSDTVSGRSKTLPTGALTVSMPHPDSPLRKNSCPGQLFSLQELGGQERTRLETSPSSSSHAVNPTGTEQLSDTAAQLLQGLNKTKKGCHIQPS